MSNSLAEGFAFQQLHDGEGLALLGSIVVDGEDVGMREGGHDLGLALEAGQPGRILGKLRGQDLDGDVAIESRVAGPIDFAHAARADGGADLVGTELGA